MVFWWLALKDLLTIIRDKKALLTLILMPILLIAILGSAFSNMLKESEDSAIQKFQLGIVNLDKGQLSKVLTTEVFEKQLSNQIEVIYYQEEDLTEKINDRKLDVGIVIESDFTTAMMAGNKAKIKLLTVPDPGVKSIIVSSVIEQFSQSIPVEAMAASLAQPVAGNQDSLSRENQINQPLLKESAIDAKTKPVSSFQYYAAAMSVMFLLMTVVQGVSTMILEKEQEVYKRLLLTHLTYKNYLTGKMLGLIIICLVQSAIIIIGTSVLFGVDWGNSLFGIMLMTIAFVVNACGLGVMAGSFMKTEKSFSVAGSLGTQIMAALGGSMVPLYVFPEWVNLATKILPNGMALQTYLDFMSGARLLDALPEISGSIGLGIIFFTIGLMRLSRGRSGRYA